MEEMLNEWNIDIKNKTIIWVTDNAKNMIKAVELSKEWIRIPCFAHTLQLSVKYCKKQMPKFNELVKATSNVVTYFSKSTIAAEMLEDVQQKLNPNVTPLKFGTLRVPVEAVTTEKKIVKKLAEEDWVLMELMKQIKEATILLSGEKYPTASLIIPVINLLRGQLQSKIDNSEGEIMILTRNLLQSLETRFKECLQSDILIVAMIVNPHYKDKIINSDHDRKNVIKVFTKIMMTNTKREVTNKPFLEIKKENTINEIQKQIL
ncbi:uncharacterized protein LOC116417796 [Nasonia vitripennis]|uniref:Uncharacterized protein n=1 Tax=Nasonia vitripennis TaxID=7425 RepID=A0A7M7QMJ0_NASVI|nr:uncharacterized protein LOC116417796 [Nasonia vitripennis]